MDRRGLILGLGAALAAPVIVRAESLMQIAVLRETVAAPMLFEFKRGVEGWEVVGQVEWVMRRYRAVLTNTNPALVAVAA